MKDINHLFKLFELTSNEFYKNEETRWKFFRTFGATVSGLIIASYKLPEMAVPLLILTMIISLGGLITLIYVYRIIVAIDSILTRLQREIIAYLFEDETNKIPDLLYPESSQFLRGHAYFFSNHNAATLILNGFFVYSLVELILKSFPNLGKYFLLIISPLIFVFLAYLIWYFSNWKFVKIHPTRRKK